MITPGDADDDAAAALDAISANDDAADDLPMVAADIFNVFVPPFLVVTCQKIRESQWGSLKLEVDKSFWV